eukprot:7827313-Pyramimonas_sp.AAC.1
MHRVPLNPRLLDLLALSLGGVELVIFRLPLGADHLDWLSVKTRIDLQAATNKNHTHDDRTL